MIVDHPAKFHNKKIPKKYCTVSKTVRTGMVRHIAYMQLNSNLENFWIYQAHGRNEKVSSGPTCNFWIRQNVVHKLKTRKKQKKKHWRHWIHWIHHNRRG